MKPKATIEAISANIQFWLLAAKSEVGREITS
jgi:hypothetical protein